MIRKMSILAAVVAVAAMLVVAGPIRGEALQGDATPEASPEASPQASPMASPVAQAGDVENGEKLAAQCLACHSVDGRDMVGPTWQGLYGRETTLDDGTVVVVDDEYLIVSIKNPLEQIVEGFAPSMPPYEGVLSDEDIADIIAFIKSLD